VLYSNLDLVLREVAIPMIHRLELAAVHGHHRLGEQRHIAAHHDELRADFANRLAVVLPEVGDRLEVRHQPPGEPDQLDVALRLTLQPTTRLNAVQVSIDVDLQQRRRVVRRPARLGRFGPSKPQLRQIQFVDEGANYPDRVVLRDPFIEASGNRTLCDRSAPSMNRLIRLSAAAIRAGIQHETSNQHPGRADADAGDTSLKGGPTSL
jgi:hypothetical protein